MLSQKASWKHDPPGLVRVAGIYTDGLFTAKGCKDLDQAYCSKLFHSTEGLRAVFIVMLPCTMGPNSYQGTKKACIRGMTQGDALVFSSKIWILLLSPSLPEHFYGLFILFLSYIQIFHILCFLFIFQFSWSQARFET